MLFDLEFCFSELKTVESVKSLWYLQIWSKINGIYLLAVFLMTSTQRNVCSGQNTAYPNHDIPCCFEYALAFVHYM